VDSSGALPVEGQQAFQDFFVAEVVGPVIGSENGRIQGRVNVI
jgi:hypothetical protein